MIKTLKQRSQGFLLCILIGVFAIILSPNLSIGTISLSIVLGLLVRNLIKPGKKYESGINFSSNHLLSFAVVFMGVNLNFLILKELGINSILIVIIGVIFTISSSLIMAKIFKFEKRFALLLGIGNAICGSSAIAATKDIVGVSEEKVGLSVGIVNFLGTIGMFVLPLIATFILKLDDVGSGVLIGNTLQAVGQVIASGFSVNESVGQTATIVKMVRVLMLTPVVLVLIYAFARKNKNSSDGKAIKKQGVPLFIIGFILFSLIPTFQLLPQNYIYILSRISHYSLIVAMAGVGMKITFNSILKDGKSALLIASLVFVLQIAFTSAMVLMFLN
ncbi:MAG: putative sulfate exporter family transporter [Candidatus Delongbacteria bacterium]|jgi:uncharacterized integral membrane protein (TIGR00698 family)|nr:putative sulfate exporter family transporter [Candidatus Delongbacteria bacterium]